jgi:uncharacterized membrane protein YjjP (DUF1212 family)
MSDLERLAIVETKVENLEDQHKELLKLLHEIKDEMTRYKGFLGGIAFLVSCLAVAVSIFKDWILKHL